MAEIDKTDGIVESPPRKISAFHYAFAALVIFLGIYIRYQWLSFASNDYLWYFKVWFDFIKSHEGFQSLRYDFSIYPPTYLYFLVVLSYLPIPNLYAIKCLSVLFDLFLARYAFLIVWTKYGNKIAPALTYAAVFLGPTVIYNSAILSQSDSTYTAFLVVAVYFLLVRKPFWAVTAFAIAMSFKLQAIFLFPFLFVLWLRKELPLKHVLILPAVWVITNLPAALIGRPVMELIMTYPNQVTHPIGVTANAANAYLIIVGDMSYFLPGQIAMGLGLAAVICLIVFGAPKLKSILRELDLLNRTCLIASIMIPVIVLIRPLIDIILFSTNQLTAFDALQNIAPGIAMALSDETTQSMITGVALMMALISMGAFCILIWRSSKRILIDPDLIVRLSFLWVLYVPYILPKMHERYFYAADVLSVVMAFFMRKHYWVPLVVITVSFMSLVTYMRGDVLTFPFPYASLALAITVIILVCEIARDLFYSESRYSLPSSDS
jgi:Gpi18-like mannosyltransferase